MRRAGIRGSAHLRARTCVRFGCCRGYRPAVATRTRQKYPLAPSAAISRSTRTSQRRRRSRRMASSSRVRLAVMRSRPAPDPTQAHPSEAPSQPTPGQTSWRHPSGPPPQGRTEGRVRRYPTPAPRALRHASPGPPEVCAFTPLIGSTGEDPVTGSLNASLAMRLLSSGKAAACFDRCDRLKGRPCYARERFPRRGFRRSGDMCTERL